jgi:hypothetical protein
MEGDEKTEEVKQIGKARAHTDLVSIQYRPARDGFSGDGFQNSPDTLRGGVGVVGRVLRHLNPW